MRTQLKNVESNYSRHLRSRLTATSRILRSLNSMNSHYNLLIQTSVIQLATKIILDKLKVCRYLTHSNQLKNAKHTLSVEVKTQCKVAGDLRNQTAKIQAIQATSASAVKLVLGWQMNMILKLWICQEEKWRMRSLHLHFEK